MFLFFVQILFYANLWKKNKQFSYGKLYLGFLRIAGQSARRTDSIRKNTLARRWMSLWALARLSMMFWTVASGSRLKRVGTGPAAMSPSKMSPWSGQAESRTDGMLSLK